MNFKLSRFYTTLINRSGMILSIKKSFLKKFDADICINKDSLKINAENIYNLFNNLERMTIFALFITAVSVPEITDRIIGLK